MKKTAKHYQQPKEFLMQEYSNPQQRHPFGTSKIASFAATTAGTVVYLTELAGIRLVRLSSASQYVRFGKSFCSAPRLGLL